MVNISGKPRSMGQDTMRTNQVARTNPSIVDALMKLIIVTRLCIDYDESCIQWMLLIDGRVYAALLYL